jgi:hypothetical protein
MRMDDIGTVLGDQPADVAGRRAGPEGLPQGLQFRLCLDAVVAAFVQPDRMAMVCEQPRFVVHHRILASAVSVSVVDDQDSECHVHWQAAGNRSSVRRAAWPAADCGGIIAEHIMIGHDGHPERGRAGAVGDGGSCRQSQRN